MSDDYPIKVPLVGTPAVLLPAFGGPRDGMQVLVPIRDGDFSDEPIPAAGGYYELSYTKRSSGSRGYAYGADTCMRFVSLD